MAFLAVFSGMSWGLHLWGLVSSATIGEALKGARESPIFDHRDQSVATQVRTSTP